MRSVQVSLRVFESVAEHQPIGVGELSQLLALPKTTVHRSLETLAGEGWIEATEHDWRRWRVSIKVMSLVQRASNKRGGIRDLTLPIMEELRDQTKESIHLVLRDENDIVLIERLDSMHTFRIVNPLGGRSELHTCSTGKAILARLREDERDSYLDRPLQAATPATITQRKALEEELEAIRQRGYATNRGESQPEQHAVGAAILDRNGRAIAAISISAPANRLDQGRFAEYGQLVIDGARRVSEALAAH